ELALFDKLMDYCRSRNGKLIFGDSDALNVVLAEEWVPQSIRYNFVPDKRSHRAALKRAGGEPAIPHFAGSKKPWSLPYDISAMGHRYWQVRNETPYREGVPPGAVDSPGTLRAWLRRRVGSGL